MHLCFSSLGLKATLCLQLGAGMNAATLENSVDVKTSMYVSRDQMPLWKSASWHRGGSSRLGLRSLMAISSKGNLQGRSWKQTPESNTPNFLNLRGPSRCSPEARMSGDASSPMTPWKKLDSSSSLKKLGSIPGLGSYSGSGEILQGFEPGSLSMSGGPLEVTKQEETLPQVSLLLSFF